MNGDEPEEVLGPNDISENGAMETPKRLNGERADLEDKLKLVREALEVAGKMPPRLLTESLHPSILLLEMELRLRGQWMEPTDEGFIVTGAYYAKEAAKKLREEREQL